MSRYLLENGTDRLLLESGDFLLLEHILAGTDSFTVTETTDLATGPWARLLETGASLTALLAGTESVALTETAVVDPGATLATDSDALTLSEAGVTVAAWVDAESLAFTDSGEAHAAGVGVDAVALDEGASATVVGAGVESLVVADASTATALLVDTDSLAVSDAGVAEAVDDSNKTGADSFAMAEIEALLAEVAHHEDFALTDSGVVTTPSTTPAVDSPPLGAATFLGNRPQREPEPALVGADDPEVLALLGAWEFYA